MPPGTPFYPAVNLPSPPRKVGGSPFGGTWYSDPERSWVEWWIKRNRNRRADIEFYKYACPEGTKYHRVTLPNCDEELLVTSTAGRTTFAPGSRVVVASHQGQRQKVIIGSPPPGQVGITNFPVISEALSIDSVGIVSAVPSTIFPGETKSVTLTGFGFLETPIDTFEAVKYDATLKEYVSDSYITVSNPVWVDSETVTVDVTCLTTAPIGYLIDISVERS